MLGEDFVPDRTFKAIVAYQYGVCLMKLHNLDDTDSQANLSDAQQGATNKVRNLWQETIRLYSTLDEPTIDHYSKLFPPSLTQAIEAIASDPLMQEYMLRELFAHGLDLAKQDQKSKASEVLALVLKRLDWNKSSHREMIVTAHIRLAALCSDTGNIQEAANHAEWVLRNAPPSDQVLRMMIETILEGAGRKQVVSSLKTDTASHPSSTSTSSGGSFFLVVVMVLICIAAVIYVASKNNQSTYNTSGQAGNTRRINTENLNLRSGPGAKQPVIMKLPQGTEVIILNEMQNVGGSIWSKVRVGQQEGWVNQKYLQ